MLQQRITIADTYDLVPLDPKLAESLPPLGPVISELPFHGQNITVVRHDDGQLYVVMKPLVENLGLNWDSQRQRIMRDSVLSDSTVTVTVEGQAGYREMTCLLLDMVHGWLFTIDHENLDSNLREKVITYKRECYKALHDYFVRGYAINSERFKDQLSRLHTPEGVRTGAVHFHYAMIAWSVIVRASEAIVGLDKVIFMNKASEAMLRIHASQEPASLEDKMHIVHLVLSSGVVIDSDEIVALAWDTHVGALLSQFRRYGMPLVKVPGKISRYKFLIL